MTRDEAIGRIRAHEQEMRAAGMDALYLFGSTARGEAGPQSDVDLACDITNARKIGLFEFIAMQQRLEELLGTRVDLVERKAMGARPRVAVAMHHDSVQVF
ncbi:nucleotidyltransferase family protein [soil metagenome]|jgi:predicted nucleotidyltransferase|uniref:nucleotidyltransferase family protein n=1 Tax=unclassified Sphingobium TaxID=2611147 RepID=UPI001E4FC2B5|nr:MULTISPECIES: nucleotidyltransferase domain-containing protein [unclassified Sphingobium]GLI97262.1 hypothetical protein Sbs19_10800 [Sphingobium sp. BS19]|tara:strand:+ start:366 stop:668 length:303 start_codon:yes stop_codon:yes gene_type:complete